MIVCDDNIEDHPKFVGLSDGSFGLWFRCIGYCRRNTTDGFIPELAAATRARSRNPTPAIAELLKTAPGCSNPLWHRVEGGYRVHDYLDWNPSREDVLAKLEVNREKGRKGGLKSGRLRRESNPEASQGQAAGLVLASTQQQATGQVPARTQTNPDPIRSDPIRSDPISEAEAEARATRPPPPDEVPLDANGRAILEELKRHPKLQELADARTASALAGRIMIGTRIEDVLHAIDETAFDLLEGSSAEVARSKLRKYVANAKPHADTKRAKRGGPPTAPAPADRAWSSHTERLAAGESK